MLHSRYILIPGKVSSETRGNVKSGETPVSDGIVSQDWRGGHKGALLVHTSTEYTDEVTRNLGYNISRCCRGAYMKGEQSMMCPLCQKDMPILRKDTCNSRACSKTYARILFFCPTDDVWMSLEIPHQQSQSQPTHVSQAPCSPHAPQKPQEPQYPQPQPASQSQISEQLPQHPIQVHQFPQIPRTPFPPFPATPPHTPRR